MVSDEVWGQLDPAGGRLSPRGRRRLVKALLYLLLLAEAGVALWASGAVFARVTLDTDNYNAQAPDGGPITYQLRLRNDGWLPVTVPGTGRIPPGKSLPITIVHRPTCPDSPTEPVAVQRFWGTQVVEVEVPELPGVNIPSCPR